MATALDIIIDALQKLGAYAPGETLSDADAQRGLSVMNDMLDTWSNETLMIYCNQQQSIAMVAGQAAYNLSSPRPLSIISSPGGAFIQDSTGNNYPCDIIEQNEWNLIGNRTVTSNVPDTIFYDPQYPTGVLNVFPTPMSAGYTLFFIANIQLADLATLSSNISLPPGYKAAITYNLAVELHPYFGAGQLSQIVMAKAAETKGTIKRKNARPPVAVFDPEIISRGSPTYNIYRDV